MNREEFQSPSPENHIAKVKILKLLDRERETEKMLKDALDLIFTKPILNFLSTEVEDLFEVINGIPNVLLYNIVEKGMTGIDIFRKNTRLSTRFYLTEKEIQTMLDEMGLQSNAALIGGGWDFF